MYRRWREELRKHSDEGGGVQGDCHCLRGIGFLRKRTPHGCANPRCWLCHPEKLAPRGRANEKRAAVLFEFSADDCGRFFANAPN